MSRFPWQCGEIQFVTFRPCWPLSSGGRKHSIKTNLWDTPYKGLFLGALPLKKTPNLLINHIFCTTGGLFRHNQALLQEWEKTSMCCISSDFGRLKAF